VNHTLAKQTSRPYKRYLLAPLLVSFSVCSINAQAPSNSEAGRQVAAPTINGETHVVSEQPKGKNVLVLFSSVQYSQSLLDLIEPSIRARLPVPITFYDAYLEDPQVEEKSYRESEAETFRRRYAAVKLDLVITANPAALLFAVEYRDKIFPGVPIVFTAVGERDLDGHDWPQGVTGVATPLGLRETIDLALRLQPDTSAVAVVTGTTTWDKRFLAMAHSELVRHQDKVREIDVVGLVNEQLLERVAALPAHTVVLFQAFPQFENQPVFGTWELLSAVEQRAPTYSAFPRLCTEGCIGGVYEDDPKEKLLMADLAVRVLSGERPEHIPIQHVTDLQARVDWRALQRWHIPESALPPGTVILNRELTLWDRGRKYFIVGSALIIGQSLLIFGLFWQRSRKRKAEAELIKSEEKFSKTFRHSPLVLAISRTSDSRFIEVNESFEEQVGWKRDEVVGRSAPELNLWADAGQRATFVSEIQANGSVPNLEALIRRKDGAIRTFLVSAEVIDVAGQLCTLSVGTDITERKQAEEILSSLSRRLIEAHEEERTWIARELHDDINQRIALLTVKLSILEENPPSSRAIARSRIEEIKTELATLGSEVQSLSHRLHSSKLDYLGLENAAAAFCRELSERQNVEIEFDSDNIPSDLSKEISLCVFRVLQESLHNAVKYSGVPKFQVSLKVLSDDVELSVHDSGVGFDPAKAINGHGLGLTSMKERLKLVHGQLSIDSKPGHGTTVHARVPLKAIAAAADV